MTWWYNWRRAFGRVVVWAISFGFCTVVTMVLSSMIAVTWFTQGMMIACVVGSAIAATIVLLGITDESTGIRID